MLSAPDPIPLTLGQLRARIALLESGCLETVSATIVPFGVPALDRALPWGGLPGGLHEIRQDSHADGLPHEGAALGFAAYCLGKRAEKLDRPILWITDRDPPYPPGLAVFGLAAHRLILLRSHRSGETLWALEEGLRCADLAAVFSPCRDIGLTAARRLSLAARDSGVAGFLLSSGKPLSSSLTRWQIAPLPSTGPAASGVEGWRWHLRLTRCRGRSDGNAPAWDVQWDEKDGLLRPIDGTAEEPVRDWPLRAKSKDMRNAG